MKKTFTANLNGTVFHIEEDAYDQLQRYLANIRAKFSGSAEAEEIMADIEARIAELFTERLQSRQAVSMSDVDHVKQVMGQPEDYVDADGPEAPADTAERAYHQYGPRRRKRLFRDPDDRWVGGVISGLANYFGTDPMWFRIAFIVVVIAGWGSPVLIYLIMWALVPEAVTAAEKLEMQGEDVTVENIKRKFDEGAERFKSGAEKVAGEAREMGRRYWHRSKDQRRHMEQRAGSAGHRVIDALGKVFGVFLLFVAIILGLSLMAALLGGNASWSNGAFTGGTGLMGLMGFIFPSGPQAVGFVLSVMVLGLVPVVLLLLAALWLLFRITTPRWAGWGLTTLFIAALVATTWFSIRLAADFRAKGVERTPMHIPTPANGVLAVTMADEGGTDSHWGMGYRRGVVRFNTNLVEFDGDLVHLSFARLHVLRSPDSAYHLLTERSARGFRAPEAEERAAHIQGQYAWSEEEGLRLARLYSIPLDDKMRAQRLTYILQIPLGGRVYFAPHTKVLMDDLWDGINDRYELDEDMAGGTWEMTRTGLMRVDGAGVMPSHAPEAPEPPAPPASTNEQSSSAALEALPAAQLSPAYPNLFHLLTNFVRL